MKHPSEASLALHAGGDLGFPARWLVARHVARCGACRDEMAALAATRRAASALGEVPNLPWSRMAARMRANIRLGLEAGECVRETAPVALPIPWLGGARAAVALAGVLVLIATALVLDRPVRRAPVARGEGVLVQATADGIQVRDGARALSLLHAARAYDVTYSVEAQGSMRARYVDPDTGYVTINHVYAQ